MTSVYARAAALKVNLGSICRDLFGVPGLRCQEDEIAVAKRLDEIEYAQTLRVARPAPRGKFTKFVEDRWKDRKDPRGSK